MSAVSVARGNVVLADHGAHDLGGETAAAAEIARGDRPLSGRALRRTRDHAFAARPRPMTRATAIGPPARRRPPAFATRARRCPRSRLADGRRRAGSRVRDLLEQRPLRAPTSSSRSRATARRHLRFGDGVLGTRAGRGRDVRARLPGRRGTAARAGNVGAEASSRVVTARGDGIERGAQPAAGDGRHRSRERSSEVRQYAPQAFRIQERAVTEADYAEVAAAPPRGPARRRALPLDRELVHVFVTVDRGRRGPSTRDFEDALRALPGALSGSAGYDLEIDAPLFVPLDLVLRVCVRAGLLPRRRAGGAAAVFSSRHAADGTRGFFHPDNFTFGQPRLPQPDRTPPRWPSPASRRSR